MRCPRCGTENLDERIYCWKCMAPLRSSAMGTIATAPTLRAQTPTPKVQPSPTFSAVAGEKSYLAAALLAWFLGFLGIDRFYLGYIGLGVIKLLTCGGCGIWQLIDSILIVAGFMRDSNGKELRRTPNDWVIVMVIVVATIIVNIFYSGFSVLLGLLQQQKGSLPIFKPTT
ncbi:MAG: TM2 domain-containing protein [Armatimonadetes bacterium]|nr:TM2 domain-containing protein [Armatimonadota bacterium]MDW8027279.1 TM2 domain-containing protein [Armatimonadota bacterium]